MLPEAQILTNSGTRYTNNNKETGAAIREDCLLAWDWKETGLKSNNDQRLVENHLDLWIVNVCKLGFKS